MAIADDFPTLSTAGDHDPAPIVEVARRHDHTVLLADSDWVARHAGDRLDRWFAVAASVVEVFRGAEFGNVGVRSG